MVSLKKMVSFEKGILAQIAMLTFLVTSCHGANYNCDIRTRGSLDVEGSMNMLLSTLYMHITCHQIVLFDRNVDQVLRWYLTAQ